ncbi:MAG TPA: hypothetical protein VK590_12655 [Saprospiraceae bacterium]|nr:hypothetical protein [Saprospiraceae bacterium]
MTPEELYVHVINQTKVNAIHPFHKALLEECCENAANNPDGVTDPTALLIGVGVAFISAKSSLKSILLAAFEQTSANEVTLNYRNQSFVIPENSPLLL